MVRTNEKRRLTQLVATLAVGLGLVACLDVKEETVDEQEGAHGGLATECLNCHHADNSSTKLKDDNCGKCHHPGTANDLIDETSCQDCHHSDGGNVHDLEKDKDCSDCHHQGSVSSDQNIESGMECTACHHNSSGSGKMDEEDCSKCHHNASAPGIDHADCSKCHHEDGYEGSCDTCHSLNPTSGAHQAHLNGPNFGTTMTCTDCHVLPSAWFDGDHLNAKVEVIFGDLATDNGALEPVYDGQLCQNVYCHGSTMSGISDESPQWEEDLPSGIQCGACHGIPPQVAHPNNGNCEMCHSASYEDGVLQPDTHINGTVDLGAGEGS